MSSGICGILRALPDTLDRPRPQIRHAEVVNWTSQAVVCPRARVSELSGWADETERPGVYLLLGKDDETVRAPRHHLWSGRLRDRVGGLPYQVQLFES